eukprot:scaffold1023_cov313-Pinguiococcus_pyrenoidosus.AAC.31
MQQMRELKVEDALIYLDQVRRGGGRPLAEDERGGTRQSLAGLQQRCGRAWARRGVRAPWDKRT